MGSLTVHFRGICVHFPHGHLQGIPHRVVVPDAKALRFGAVETPGRHEVGYALPPHFPVLLAKDVDLTTQTGKHGPIGIGGLIKKGIHLSVENSGAGVSYGCGSFDADVPKITYFVGQVPFSPEVVLNGAASCYFDVSGGVVDVDHKDSDPTKSIVGVRITIETTGPPVLLVSQLSDATAPAPVPTRIELPAGDAELIVGNVDSGRGEGGADGVDFLLNFLVLQGGIPDRIIQPLLPGSTGKSLPNSMRRSFLDSLLDAIWQLRNVKAPDDIVLPPWEALFSDNISCSNTQYP
jgi:hypothetical protein